MNKTNAAGIGSRNDILWFCVECIPLLYEMFGGSSAPGSQSEGGKNDDSLAQSIVDKILAPENVQKIVEPIKAQVEKSITEKVPDAIDHSINVSMAKLPKSWAEVVSDSIELSDSGEATDKNADDDFSVVVTKRQRKVAAAQIQAVKEVAQQWSVDEENREKREKNVVLFRVPESTAETDDDKKKEDKQFVTDLLKAIKVNDDDESGGRLCPKNIFRLGKFDRNRKSPRPIKIELESKTEQNLIMTNAKNLANAIPKFKKISICHDLSETERQNLSILIEQANEKSKNSDQFIWKVRGPPSKMELKRFPKRK